MIPPLHDVLHSFSFKMPTSGEVMNEEGDSDFALKMRSGVKDPLIEDNIPLHENIQKKIDFFLQTNKIPHIIFHGSSGTGKRTIVYNFINKIYHFDRQKIKTNVMFVNCAHGKGIKFIREELKLFAKSNIQSNSGVLFKTIVLMNADFLTIDAQSALRRCIELFSYNTRFFIIVENKNKLLNPILSRFCEIYVPEHIENNKVIVLHQYNLKKKMDIREHEEVKQNFISGILPNPGILFNDLYRRRFEMGHPEGVSLQIVGDILPSESSEGLKGDVDVEIQPLSKLIDISTELYENGISCLDLMRFVEESGWWDEESVVQFMMDFYNVKAEYRCEKLLMFYMMNLIWRTMEPPKGA